MSDDRQPECQESSRVNLVTIGGGTGSSTLLRGLKRYSDRIDITAIVTTFDDGGSSGRLGRQFGVPALGDLRRCIAALLPDYAPRSWIARMLEHRFTSTGDLDDHSLGNLMLLGMWQRTGSLMQTVETMCESLDLLGRVIPISDEPANICAILEDGTLIRGESNVGARNQDLFECSSVYLEPSVAVNPAAKEALLAADLIILGPGDLFTSVVPNLLPCGVTDAIRESSALILQVCNLATKQGETSTYTASDFASTINRYLDAGQSVASVDRRVDAMIINGSDDGHLQPENAIKQDSRLFTEVGTVIVKPVSDRSNPRNHDSVALASAIMEYIGDAIAC